MRLLLVKLSSMGDIIHAFPAVTEAVALRPDLEIDWCVDSAFSDLVRLHPAIGTIHQNGVAGRGAAPVDGETWRRLGRLRADLRACAYDRVIDAQGLIRSAAIARLSGAPVAGYDRHSIRETPAALAYRHRFSISRGLHAITRIRLLFGAALGYPVDPANSAVTRLELRAASPERMVFLLHGTTANSKRWPTQHWVGLAKAAAGLGLAPVTTWSDEAERSVANAIKSAAPATRVIPKSSLAAIAAEIGRASIVVGVDTGLAHLADAAGLPTIMIFQASNPDLTGPRGARSEALIPDGGTPTRPLRRAAQLPPDPARIVPLASVLAVVARIAGHPA